MMLRYLFIVILITVLGVGALLLAPYTYAFESVSVGATYPRPFGGTTVYTDQSVFEADYPDLTFEGLDESQIFISSQYCRTPWNLETTNTCFGLNTIAPGVSFHRVGTGGNGPGSLQIEAFSRDVRLQNDPDVEERLELEFRPLVHAVGVKVTANQTYTLSALDNSGTEVFSTTINPALTFLGFYSDIPVRSVQLSVVEGTGYFDAVLFALPDELLLDGSVARTPTCDTSSFLVASTGQTVYPCYHATNQTPYTLTTHTLTESGLGTIFSNLPYTLAPGASITTQAVGYTLSTTVTAPITATALWTATDGVSITTSAVATTGIRLLTPYLVAEPTTLSDSHPTAPQITTDTLTLSNSGEGSITWSFYEDGTPRGGENPALLYDQRGEGTASVFSQYSFLFEGFSNAIAADDFTVPPGQTWTVTGLVAEGEYMKGNTVNSWILSIAEDNNGVPGETIASLVSTVYTDTNGTVTFEVEPQVLSAGRYWLRVSAYVNAVEPVPNDTEWHWFTVNGQRNAPYQWFNDLYQFTSPCYQKWDGGSDPCGQSPITENNLAFALYGTASHNGAICDSQSALEWASVDPATGTILSSDSHTVTVTYDSAGLESGDYTGTLCLLSDDPDQSLLMVPLSLEVNAPPTATPTPTLSPTVTASPTQPTLPTITPTSTPFTPTPTPSATPTIPTQTRLSLYLPLIQSY